MPGKRIDKSRYPEIMDRLSGGETGSSIAAELGVTQAAISRLRKRQALKLNGPLSISHNETLDNTDSLRAFINKAWQAREDSLAWREIKATTDLEWDLAIDAADGVATAWKRAVNNLTNGRGK